MGLGCRVSDLVSRVQSSGFRVQDLGAHHLSLMLSGCRASRRNRKP